VDDEMNDLVFTTKRTKCDFWNADLAFFGEIIPTDPMIML